MSTRRLVEYRFCQIVGAIVLLALFSVASSHARADRPLVIYGKDDRREALEIERKVIKKAARATVALIPKATLRAQSENRYGFAARTAAKAFDLCSTERFSRQPAAAFCSGVLVAPDMIVTAGHCVTSRSECRATAFVFDYRIENQNLSVTVPKTSVHSCDTLLWTQSDEEGDFAIVKLNRRVTDRSSIAIRRARASVGAPLTLLGHPLGVPLKWAPNGRVRARSDVYITAALDSYAGNSGSPVLNSRTGRLEGILARGEADFRRRGTCNVSKRCSVSGCLGEDYTDIKRIMSRLLHSF